MAQWSTRINQVVFDVQMCHEQWALTVIKLLRFFVLIFAVFIPDLFIPQWHNHPSFIKIVDVFDLYTP